MAKFSQTFLQGLLQPSYQQGLFEAARGVGMTPGLMRMQKQQQEEKARRDKGVLSGNMAIQQAAQAGNLTEEMLRSYAGSMQGLGVPNEDIIKTVSDLRQVNQAASKQNKSRSFVESLGSEYAAHYDAGFSVKDVHSMFLADEKQDSIVALAQQLDPSLSTDLASNMTSSDLISLYESKIEENGAQKWAKWQADNPQITDDNRQQAIEAAVAAHGKDAPKKVADLEARQLENKAKKEGDKSVPVLITMKSNSAFGEFELPGASGKVQITVKKLPVNADGKLSDAAKTWLQAYASSAMVQDTGEPWEETPDPSDDVQDSGQGGEGTTLSQLAPSLVTGLTNTQFKE